MERTKEIGCKVRVKLFFVCQERLKYTSCLSDSKTLKIEESSYLLVDKHDFGMNSQFKTILVLIKITEVYTDMEI